MFKLRSLRCAAILVLACLLPLVLSCSGQKGADPAKGTDKDTPNGVEPPRSNKAIDEAAEAPKEESVVPHDSKTHGALQVKSVGEKTSDWFDVLQNGKRAFAGNPPLLNKTIELAPGAYVVSVNRTERKVTIEAGKKTVLLTGELVVEAKKGTPGWYTPYQGEEAKVTATPPLLNSPLALFAGKYTVFYRAGGGGNAENLGAAEVKPGSKTVLKR